MTLFIDHSFALIKCFDVYFIDNKYCTIKMSLRYIITLHKKLYKAVIILFYEAAALNSDKQ